MPLTISVLSNTCYNVPKYGIHDLNDQLAYVVLIAVHEGETVCVLGIAWEELPHALTSTVLQCAALWVARR